MNMKKSYPLHSNLGGHEQWNEFKVLLKAFTAVIHISKPQLCHWWYAENILHILQSLEKDFGGNKGHQQYLT